MSVPVGFPDPSDMHLEDFEPDSPETETFRDEFLRFLSSIKEDDVAPTLRALVKHPSVILTSECKQNLLTLITHISSQEFIINNYPTDAKTRENRAHRLRELGFDLILHELEIKTFEIDAISPWYSMIVGIMDEHYNNRLYRSRDGYEREMQTQRKSVEVSHSKHKDESSIDARSGVSRLMPGMGGSQ